MSKVIKLFRYNFYSLQEKIFSSRTITTVVLLLMIHFIFAIPILTFAKDLGYRANVTSLPFFLYDLGYDCSFIAIIIYFFSGVPFLKYSEMYCIIREGKIMWVLKQATHIFYMSLVFIVIVIITSIIPFIIRGDFSNEWNEVTYTLSLTDKWSEYRTVVFPSDILNKYTPWESIVVIFLFVGLLVLFMGMFLFTLSLLFNRITALCIGFGFEILTITAFNTRVIDNYLIYISPFSWLDLTIFGRKYNGTEYIHGTPTIEWCVCILLLIIIGMLIIDIIRVKHMNFYYNDED